MFIRSIALLVATTISIAATGCAATAEEAVGGSEDAIIDEGVVSIVLVERDPSNSGKDLFAVTCGSEVKRVTRAQLNGPEPVCAGGPSGVHGLTCTSHGGAYYPTRIETGATLGSGMDERVCQDIVRASTSELTCLYAGGAYYPTRIESGVTLGSGMDEDVCVAVLRVSRRSLTCLYAGGAYYPTPVETGVTLGSGMDKDACITIVAASAADLTCIYAGGAYYPTRIATGATIGSGQSLDSCVASL